VWWRRWRKRTAQEGFEPRVAYRSDDMVVIQSLVAAGLGATLLPGLALRSHRVKGIVATETAGSPRHVYPATYGEAPDPPATTALLVALAAGLIRPSGQLQASAAGLADVPITVEHRPRNHTLRRASHGQDTATNRGNAFPMRLSLP
jgi:hypothetical protein